MADDELIILCGTVPMPNAELAFCFMCGKQVWPTKGTAKAAAADGAKLICFECLPADSQYCGFTHHGIFLPDATVDQVLDLLRHDLERRR
jgi:hypothetical protein